MMPMIFLGMRPRPAMPFCFAEWSKERLNRIVKLKKLIESGRRMLKGTMLLVFLDTTVRKLVRKISNQCHVNTTIKAPVINPKLTKLGVWFIDTFALHALTMANPPHTQKMNAKIRPKNYQKRLNPSDPPRGTRTYPTRLFFNKKCHVQNKEIVITKQQAFSWFHRSSAYKKVSPSKTYADVVKRRNGTRVLAGDSISNKYEQIARKCNPRFSDPHTSHFHRKAVTKAKKQFISTGNTGKTSNLHESPPLSLHNRFSVLHDENTGLDNTQVTCLFTSARDGNICKNYNTEGHSQGRKRPPFLGTELQSQLTVQEKCSLQGNKNENGLLQGSNLGTKKEAHTKDTVSMLLHSDNTEKQEEIGLPPCDSSFKVPSQATIFKKHSNGCERSYQSPGTNFKSQLTCQKNLLSWDNKNENGLSGGLDDGTRGFGYASDVVRSEPSDSTGVISTVDSNTLLNGNCSLHSPSLVPQSSTNGTTCTPDTQEDTFHFGFIPQGPLKLYVGDPVYWEYVPNVIRSHLLIRASGIPNYLGCRIPVQSHLNIENWKRYLVNYWDQQITDLLQYGFPLDFDRNCPLMATETNHTSALQNNSHVWEYIREELQFEAILGPFSSKPIDMHVSPLMIRDKQGSSKKRTIMDLSWPKGISVNDGVLKDTYLGTNYTLTYPSIDHITQSLVNLGPAAQLYKIDISRAFRQIKIDPSDIDLLGFKIENQYFRDQSVPFRSRHGSQIFQRCTDAIRFIMAQHSFPTLWNYIDDLIYTGLPSQIHKSFAFLQQLLQDLGLQISAKKLVAPSTSVVCLGILIDTVHRTISIPPDKLQDIVHLCKQWSTKTYASKKDLQSLLGSLLYITKCVKPARYFLNRMLHLLRQNHNNNKIFLTSEFFHDLSWFNTFLESYNGVTFYHYQFSRIPVHLDACLTGLGGHFGSMIYYLPLPRGYNSYDITQLEMLNIVVTSKIWSSHWSDKKIQIFCDNMAVVQVLTTGKARDEMLATCTRNVWLIAVMFNIDFQLSHLPGKTNILADLLSRWQVTSNPIEKLNDILQDYTWIPTHLTLTLLNHHI